MPRKRMIDPAIWDSAQAMNLTPPQFKLYIFLISSADDEGRLKYCPELMRARVYPFNNCNQEEFNTDLAQLVEIGLVMRYSDKGTEYLVHPNWLRYQKINHPTKSVLPPPPNNGDSSSTTVTLPEDSRLIEVSISKKNISKTVFADNVTLSQDEYDKLVDKFGRSGAKKCIDKLNIYKGSSGKKYESDYLTILNWVTEAVAVKPIAGTAGWPCPHCGETNTHNDSRCMKCRKDRDDPAEEDRMNNYKQNAKGREEER